MNNISEEVKKKIYLEIINKKEEIVEFASELIRCKSITGNEKEIATIVESKMKELNFDEVFIDKMGNVIGRVGDGEKSLLFDSHMDTVSVNDEEFWKFNPFKGELIDGNLYGRGSVDMKGALAVSIYAVAISKKLGLIDNKKIYISASVMEEDYDGQAVLYILEKVGIKPDAVVCCEATELAIGNGHRGRALIKITVNGKSAHGSRPELGINPLYGLARIIEKIKNLSFILSKNETLGSVAITGIGCITASANSIPESAYITIDRRLTLVENYQYIKKEMDEIIAKEDAIWEICDIPGKSWRGEPLTLHSFLPAWEIEKNNSLVICAKEAYKNVLKKDGECIKLGYSTNAVATAGIHKIPSIVLGPGSTEVAHMRDEYCSLDQLLKACQIYVNLCALYK